MATKAKTEWYKDNFLISTKSSLIQPAAVNAAMDSDLMYWTRAMDEGELKRMLDNSLCFGVYELPESSSAIAGAFSVIPHFPFNSPINDTHRQKQSQTNRTGSPNYRSRYRGVYNRCLYPARVSGEGARYMVTECSG
jgi:hypothetical protein